MDYQEEDKDDSKSGFSYGDVSITDTDAKTIVHVVNSIMGTVKTFGLIGLGVIVLGCVLLFLGASGESSWAFDAFGLTSKLERASPGLVGIVAGTIIIVVALFRGTSVQIGKNSRRRKKK